MAPRKPRAAEEPEEAPAPDPHVDPPPVEEVSPAEEAPKPPDIDPGASPVDLTASPTRAVRILSNLSSIEVAGAHYTLNAGAIMVLPSPVADGLIAQRLAEEI